MANKANMAERVTHEFARLILRELNDICPQESMNRYLWDLDAEILNCQFVDGNLVLEIKRPKGVYTLTLKPVEWKRK